MRQLLKIRLLIPALLGLWALPLFGQVYGQVAGVCKDLEGKPITGALVQFVSTDTGRKYELKTDASGKFMSIGINPETYNISLVKDGKELDRINKFRINAGENTIDFDLQKNQVEGAKKSGVDPEKLKKMQEENAKVEKKNTGIKAINEKLVAADTAIKAGDYDTAIASLNEANQIDPSFDLVWFKLADTYRASAAKQTDKAEKDRRLGEAVTDYQKAIAMKKTEAEAANPKKPEDSKTLASYYNNLADAYSRQGKPEGAIEAYTQAANLDPAGSAMYYFNLGAVMTNTGRIDDAISAFDKSLAADPTKAAAYYWKGVNLMGKATLKGDKMEAPAGTSEAFNKYLELEPTGVYADASKQMLESIGATVETSFGKRKTATKK